LDIHDLLGVLVQQPTALQVGISGHASEDGASVSIGAVCDNANFRSQ
jgi:hypothetical protein